MTGNEYKNKPRIEKSRRRRNKVLVFATLSPTPIDRGDKNRLYHVLELLSEQADVRLAFLDRDWDSQFRGKGRNVNFHGDSFPVKRNAVLSAGFKAMIRHRPYLAFRYDITSVRNFVTRQIDDYQPDIFWGYQISASPFLRSSPAIYRVLDLVDSPSRQATVALADKYLPVGAKVVHLLNWRIDKFEGDAVRNCEKLLLSSVQDCEYVQKNFGADKKAILLPNCVSSQLTQFEWLPRTTHSPSLLFVGNLNYQPNREAVVRFLDSTFPLLRKKIPNISLKVIGSGDKRIPRKFHVADGVTFTGYVDNLIDEYLAANAMIAPLTVATGSQYKVLEAMAVGLPVIATRMTGEAVRAKAGRQLLVADSATEYLDAIGSLSTNLALAAGLSAASRQFISENYLWEMNAQIISDILSDAVRWR